MNTKLTIDDSIVKELNSPVPQELIFKRDGGHGQKLNYVSLNTMVTLLNKSYGFGWDWQLDERWIEGKEKSEVYYVSGTLTIPMVFTYTDADGKNQTIIRDVKKQAIGGKATFGKPDAETWKSAASYAFKKAASWFGVAATVYRKDIEEDYFQNADEINNDEEWAFIKKVIDEYDLTEKDINERVVDWSNGGYKTIDNVEPQDVAAFAAYLKECIEASDESETK